MTPDSLSRLRDVHEVSKLVSTKNIEEVRVLFQLLRLGDLCTSMAWHSIWHGLEKTP